MGTKADLTRDRIIQQAAVVFNQQGYAGASISDVMKATGLKKGGIYNHFKSKDELAIAAFDFAVGVVQARYREGLRGKRTSSERLVAIIRSFCGQMDDPPIPGGCPLLNTAIESDDTHPVLRRRVKVAMDNWRAMIQKILALGIKHQEIDPSIHLDQSTTVIIANLEGALMMSQLYSDRTYLETVEHHLISYIQSLRLHPK